MVARTTGQPKRETQWVKTEPARSRARSGGKAAAKKKAPGKVPAKKSTVGKKAAKATAQKSDRETRTGAGDGATAAATEAQMLSEQNAALKAELAQAKARIKELEALNADVINRIDWVIDSLQTVVEDKR